MTRSALVLVFVSVLALVPAVAVASPEGGGPQPHTPPHYFVDESKLPFAPAAGHEDAERLWGVHKGAGYRVEVPADWNGDLVMYAHGFRGEGAELTVSNPPFRTHLLDAGYAWAASSYAQNGYAVAQGVKDTLALQKRFNGLVDNPGRVYIAGHSMGGHITGVAIEQYANAFDGALPMCGVMGDRELFDYFLDYNVVAAALAGVGPVFPADEDYLVDEVVDIKDALWDTFPVAPNASGLALAGVTQQRSGGTRPLFDVAFVVWADFLFTLNGDGSISGLLNGNIADNDTTTYQVDDDPALNAAEQFINATVQRVDADRHLRVSQGLNEVPAITGDLSVPTISLHTLGDLFVPFSMEQIYARDVAAQGKSDLLVQRAIRDVGHCGFTLEEQARAFIDLVDWVESGVTPDGDDVLTPSVVAEPTYGCAFTTISRPYDPVTCPGS